MPPRAHRRNKRGVKRKMSSFPVRRKADRPPPSINIATAIRILRQDLLEAPVDGPPAPTADPSPKGPPGREHLGSAPPAQNAEPKSS